MGQKVTSIIHDLAKSLLHRLDGWGVALIIAALALLIHDLINGQTILLLAAVTIMYWLGFTLNDYHDAPYDAQDEVKAQYNFFVHHPMAKNQALIGLLLVCAFPLFAFAQFGLKGIATLGLYFFFMIGYSIPPLRFKSRPGLDLLAHGLIVQTSAYLACLLVLEVVWTPLDYVMLAINFFASLAGQLQQQIRDFDLDSKTDTNFATTVGLKTTKNLFKCIIALLGFICLLNVVNGTIPLFLVPFGLIALPSLINRLTIGHGQRRSEGLIYVSMITALLYTGAIFFYSLLTQFG